MPTALLITDLEGVAGVDALEALVHGHPSHERARQLLQAEVAAAAAGFRRAGFDRLLVSDSHRSGSALPHLDVHALGPGVDLAWMDDAYGPALFSGVATVACLGMHAAAGTSGFAAHTVDTHCGWSVGTRNLSETDLVMGLAAERGLPISFVSGDDVLERALAPGVRFVRTKRAMDWAHARSRPVSTVLRELEHAAASPPRAAVGPPGGALTLRFKSAWHAQLAASTGAERTGPHTVVVSGEDFAVRYRRGWRAVGVQGELIANAFRGRPGTLEFVEDALTSLGRPFPTRRAPGVGARADRALSAFLELTDGPSDGDRALRALTLHMLEGHAPGFFRRRRLGRALSRAVVALEGVPRELTPGLDADSAMARLDAPYVLKARGHSVEPLAPEALAAFLGRSLARNGPVFTWLFAELAKGFGCQVETGISPRMMRGRSRSADLYCVTHLWLLDTGYLRRPLERAGWQSEAEEMLLAVRWIEAERKTDLGGEIAFCLQLVGEQATGEHGALLRLLMRHQRRDGSVEDPGAMKEASSELELRSSLAHTTAVALLAFAGAVDRE